MVNFKYNNDSTLLNEHVETMADIEAAEPLNRLFTDILTKKSLSIPPFVAHSINGGTMSPIAFSQTVISMIFESPHVRSSPGVGGISSNLLKIPRNFISVTFSGLLPRLPNTSSFPLTGSCETYF